MPAALDALVIGLYVEIDDFLGPRHGAGTPAEAHRRRADHARGRAGPAGDAERPPVPGARALAAGASVSAADRSVRLQPPAAAPGARDRPCISYLAFISPSFCDRLPAAGLHAGPCGQSRETARRSEFAGSAGYGYCRSHSRWFWGFRLYLICAGDGMPIGWELAAANIGERVVAAEMLERIPVAGHTVIADKGFAGRDFEALWPSHGANFLRPDRKDEPAPPRQPRRRPPMDRIDLLDLQRPTRPRTPRRPHPPRTRRPHRPATARARRRHLAQPPHRTTQHEPSPPTAADYASTI